MREQLLILYEDDVHNLGFLVFSAKISFSCFIDVRVATVILQCVVSQELTYSHLAHLQAFH